MLKQFGKKLKRLRRGGKGSAIIVVLVTMTFIVVLASVLLYLSLVNMQMKKMDKGSKTNFYSAEAIMEEIRAGVQTSVSDAIKKAYSKVLVSYNTLNEAEQKEKFTRSFYEELYNTTRAQQPLFESGGAGYNADLLITYVSQPGGAEVGGSGSVTRETDENGMVASISMKGVSVKYVAAGFETTVTSDIRIKTPPLPYTTTDFTQTPAPNFAIIAKGLLQQPAGAGTVSVSGCAYASGLAVGGAGNTFNVENADDFVLAGPVEVSGGTLNVSLNSALWAGNIRLDAAGSVVLAGDTYVANDLNLAGNGTQAILSGRYFGYGDGYAEVKPPLEKKPDPDFSSAILINGRDTLLDMSSPLMRALVLAGRGYVDYNGGDNSTVLTGESIAVKSNQLAYLLPESSLKGGISNPHVFADNPSNDDFIEKCIDLDPALAQYGITDPAAHIQYIRKNIGTTSLVYFCMKFPTTDKANAYFRDYYNTHSETIQKYMDIYSNGILLYNKATKNLAGEAFTFDGTEVGPVIDGSGVAPKSVEGVKTSCSNLKVTLSRIDQVHDGATNAYDYFVDAAQLAGVFGTQIYSTNGIPRAAVTNGSYTISADTPATISLVIASGDVTVLRDFTGLIISGGAVTLYGSVTTDSGLVGDALKSLKNDDDNDLLYTYYYLNPRHISPMNSNSNDSDVGVWNLNALVTYQNWKKNAS